MVAYVYNDCLTVTTETAVAAETQEYYNNWATNIEDRKRQYSNSGFLEKKGTNNDMLNADIAEYNRESSF